MSVHVFGCQHLIIDGESVPENYQLYAKVSIGPLAKSTSVIMQTKKGKIIWNEVFNFPIVVSPALSIYSSVRLFRVSKNKLMPFHIQISQIATVMWQKLSKNSSWAY